MKQNYKILWLLFAFAAGLFGGVLRGHELAVCYHSASGLYTYDYSSYALIALCGAAVLLYVLCALLVREDAQPYASRFRLSKAGLVLNVLSGLILVVSGALYTLSTVSAFSIYRLLLGIFTVVCGVCVIVLASTRKKRRVLDSAPMAAVTTVFWACFMLIATFMEHPVEPILQLFAYDLLAMCAAALSVYCQAASVFGKNRRRLCVFSSLSAVTLLTVSVFGRLTASVFSGEAWYFTEVLFRMLVMSGLILYCGQAAAASLRGGSKTGTNGEKE